MEKNPEPEWRSRGRVQSTRRLGYLCTQKGGGGGGWLQTSRVSTCPKMAHFNHMSWIIQPFTVFCLYLINSCVNMFEILRKVSSDTTYHKTLLNYLIKELEPICVLPWQPFCQILVAVATVSGHLTFFEIKNIKFQYYYLQFSKFQKYWEMFTLVNNSLVWHQ